MLAVVLLLAVGNVSARSRVTYANKPRVKLVATVVPTPTIPANLTPVAGNYSVYIDPTYGYSFQYPSTWLVNPGVGADESNVAIQEPVYNLNDPNYPRHPFTTLMVRASNNYQVTFVQHLLCGYGFNTTVAGMPARTLDTYGGDPVSGYGAPAFGRAFYANGVAYEIWLQSSAKDYHIDEFFQDEAATWNHILATFQPGPKQTVAQGC